MSNGLMYYLQEYKNRTTFCMRMMYLLPFWFVLTSFLTNWSHPLSLSYIWGLILHVISVFGIAMISLLLFELLDCISVNIENLFSVVLVSVLWVFLWSFFWKFFIPIATFYLDRYIWLKYSYSGIILLKNWINKIPFILGGSYLFSFIIKISRILFKDRAAAAIAFEFNETCLFIAIVSSISFYQVFVNSMVQNPNIKTEWVILIPLIINIPFTILIYLESLKKYICFSKIFKGNKNTNSYAIGLVLIFTSLS